MTAEDLARLHAEAMEHGTAWSATAFESSLKEKGVFLVVADRSGGDQPEASIKTCHLDQKRPGAADTDGHPSMTSLGSSRGPSVALHGFLLGRTIGWETELLTLAVAMSARRRGLGHAILEAFEVEAQERGSKAAFLEVADDNPAALALYHKTGWHQVGQRPGYYPRPAADPANALILRKALGQP
ncbi:MAG: GNAT family N-acetyltransferase [Pseudomonadota bacterium]